MRRPRRATGFDAGRRLRLFDALEKTPPFVAYSARVALVFRLHVFDVGRIGGIQKRGAQKGFVLAVS